MTVEEAKALSFQELISMGAFDCECGRTHSGGVEHVIIEDGAIERLPELIREAGGKRPFLLSGHDSFAAAGERVTGALEKAGIAYSAYVVPVSPVKPTEETVGAAVMHYDLRCDLIIAVGSGVINDTGKLLAAMTGHRYIIVATAPSMDGFSSATSSMDRDGLKVSLDSTFAWAVVGDLDVLAAAPMRMLQAGVGDMLAKYVSLAEWKIGHLLVDEYYCPVVAALVDRALAKVTEAAPGLVKRDREAVRAVMEGMVIAGMAMTYAGLSRPASGMEHYFSHIIDMRALAFENAACDLHGTQVGVGTVYALRVYEYLKTVVPDRERALKYAEAFDTDAWNRQLLDFVGPGARAMIEREKAERKYDREKHAARLGRILDNWDEIVRIAGSLPSAEQVAALLETIGAPTAAEAFGYDREQTRKILCMTKDIRDKYIGSRLLWDLGILDEAAQAIV